MNWPPKKRVEKYLWWKNLSEWIEAEGLKIGLPAEEIAAAKARADEQMAVIERTDGTTPIHRRRLSEGAGHPFSRSLSSVDGRLGHYRVISRWGELA